ncbi:hypothetical protein DKX38_001135 [Salix brachista]|uniref:Retrovirus-related Pol polyprotein from transposon TNT 1-94-like beta-barrel domain-containing protein n=1 Tax=Salix brachista TaxID=2182728 RepID=A0A5N5P5D8_9ROSI|nr:hypothetical protein DKX38_001135 [Salix brachista]
MVSELVLQTSMADSSSSANSSSSSATPVLPLNTMVHMLTIKLTSSNYLLWRNQFIPLLTSQQLFGFLDGTITVPKLTVTDPDGVTKPNPGYNSWLQTDQMLLSLLYSSLTEEFMGEVLGLQHSHEAWRVLEASFSNRSKTRELQIKDELQMMQRGSRSIAEFSRLFKGLCDQLAAIGRPVDDTDKVHWYLRALGPDYKIFSTTMMSQLPLPSFSDVVPKALSHEIFAKSVNQLPSNSAYYAHQTPKFTGVKKWKSRPSTPSTATVHKKPSSTVYCQLCDKEGHLAKRCWSFLKMKKQQSANLAEAFSACSIQELNNPEWFPDSGATSHMTNTTEILDDSDAYTGNERVMVGNGQSLPISHVGSVTTVAPHCSIPLSNVLVVPGIQKNLISINCAECIPSSPSNNSCASLTSPSSLNSPCLPCSDAPGFLSSPSSQVPEPVLSSTTSTDAASLSEPQVTAIMPSHPPVSSNHHPMITRGKAGIVKPRSHHAMTVVSSNQFIQALLATKEPKAKIKVLWEKRKGSQPAR